MKKPIAAINPMIKGSVLYEITDNDEFYIIKKGIRYLQQPVCKFLLGYVDSDTFIISTKSPVTRLSVNKTNGPIAYNQGQFSRRVRYKKEYWIITLNERNGGEKIIDEASNDIKGSYEDKILTAAAGWLFDLLIAGIDIRFSKSIDLN